MPRRERLLFMSHIHVLHPTGQPTAVRRSSCCARRQKPPKPFAPGTLAYGSPAMLIKSGAAQLASLKQCSLESGFYCASRQRTVAWIQSIRNRRINPLMTRRATEKNAGEMAGAISGMRVGRSMTSCHRDIRPSLVIRRRSCRPSFSSRAVDP